MKDNEFYIQGGDKKNLYGKSWVPKEKPNAVVAILHDFNDHINRYENFSSFLTRHQIVTIGIDQHGHGKSPGKRGHIKGYNLILSNVQQLMIETRRRFNDLPIILYGQGMGGNIALNYALRFTSKEISGLIISSPCITNAFNHLNWNFFLVKIFGKVMPSITLRIDMDPMELTHDPVIGFNYLEDPLNHGKISFGLYKEINQAGQWILENAELLYYPTLIMHGDEDRLVSYSFSEILAKKINRNNELKIWEGLRHELHHEKSKNLVLEYILSWIHKITYNHAQN